MATQVINQSASLTHIVWDDAFLKSKPTQYVNEPPPGVPQVNFILRPAPEQNITDMRGCDEPFALDTHGFTWRKNPIPDLAWDKDTIEKTYFPMVFDLVRETVPGVSRIVAFDYRLRSSGDKASPATNLAFKNFTEVIGPFERVHIDQTPKRAKERVIEQMGDAADALLKHRWACINVWRPIHHPVKDCPLAMCDARSVGPGDLIATDNYRETFSGESYHMVHKPEHKWYYLSEQTRDEALLFKIHDSSEEVEASRCSHTAFRASNVRGTAEPRESIEVRCLVFFESEQA
ncbi:hypothetical protein PG990_008480 [Apiospora arundinis]|uniref:Methyltransferase n=1 Tax=Apiospora arundinis TaxID=335852 RepID=A0ABR2JMJ0_9PEZI